MIVRLLLGLWLVAVFAPAAQARSAVARIDHVVSAVATLDEVRVRLDWPAGATHGSLRLQASRVAAPSLGYRFRDLDWRCPLTHAPRGGWRCDGAVQAGGPPFALSLLIDDAGTKATLSRAGAAIAIDRRAATPDLTRVDLTRVPLAWTQALLAQAWPDGRLSRGTGDAHLSVTAHAEQPLRVAGPLVLRDVAFDTPSGTIAAEGVGARLDLDLAFGDRDDVRIDGRLVGGELLFGSAYATLGSRSVPLSLRADHADGQGWTVSRLQWHDEGILTAEGSAAFDAQASLTDLDLRLRSGDLAPLRDAYLSGWLGAAGLGDITLAGAAEADLALRDGALRRAAVTLHDAAIDDPRGRFRFAGLDGDVRYSASDPVDSALVWKEGALYGLALGGTRLPFTSAQGVLQTKQDIVLPLLGGRAVFDGVRIRPPSDGAGLDVRFGLALEHLDVAQLATAMHWPAFAGELSGRIPQAHYAGERLVFDGGLAMQLFGGRVAVSSLAMERPFGVAPTLSADIALDDLDLEALTGVFGFGSMTGRLDGRIDALRLVDWQPVAFDASLHSDAAAARRADIPQRISQRAVQDLSSVGDASFVTSLQSRLIGLFDDFGYSRIGIGCRLADEVCEMEGLGSAGAGFIIVQGRGLPRLTVVGFNRRVDWPTLVERLAAVGKGDVKPVVD